MDYVYLRYHTAMLDIPMKPGGHGVTLNTYLSNQSWITGIWDIILPDIAMQPIAEVHKTVVHRNQNVRDQTYMDNSR